MEVLIAAATEDEISPLRKRLSQDWMQSANGIFTHGQLSAEFLVTGVGMVRTAYHLGTRFATNRPGLCINAGVAGAFPGKFDVGQVVHIVEDCFPELGAQDAAGNHLTMEQMGLSEDLDSYRLVNVQGADYAFLPRAKGITVNTVHGEQQAIAKISDKYDPDVETMESAAFFYACLKANVPFIAIRAVSNIIEPRDRSRWDIPGAIDNLNAQIEEMLALLKS